MKLCATELSSVDSAHRRTASQRDPNLVYTSAPTLASCTALTSLLALQHCILDTIARTRGAFTPLGGWRIDHPSRALPATALAVRAQSLHTSAPTPSHIPCWPSHARCPVRLSLSPTTHSVRSHRRPALLHTWPLLSPRLRRSVTRSTFSPPPPPCSACTPP